MWIPQAGCILSRYLCECDACMKDILIDSNAQMHHDHNYACCSHQSLSSKNAFGKTQEKQDKTKVPPPPLLLLLLAIAFLQFGSWLTAATMRDTPVTG